MRALERMAATVHLQHLTPSYLRWILPKETRSISLFAPFFSCRASPPPFLRPAVQLVEPERERETCLPPGSGKLLGSGRKAERPSFTVQAAGSPQGSASDGYTKNPHYSISVDGPKYRQEIESRARPVHPTDHSRHRFVTVLGIWTVSSTGR